MTFLKTLLKAKNGILNLKKSRNNADGSETSGEQVKSLLSIFKIPILLAAPIPIFLFSILLIITAVPDLIYRSTFGGGYDSGNTSSSTTVSGNAQLAIDFAKSQVGNGYCHANEVDNCLDCNGLTYYAWKEAGVDDIPLPSGHYGEGQYQWSKETGRFFENESELQPGDIVFWGNGNNAYYNNGGLFHVGLYIGNDRVIHAYNEERGIIETPMSEMDYPGSSFIGGAHLNV